MIASPRMGKKEDIDQETYIFSYRRIHSGDLSNADF